MRTRVKICGITNVEDALAASTCGADAIGLVFYPPSPRFVSLSRAAEIIAALPPFVTVTGLFVDADAETIDQVVATLGIDLIQFHGNETPEYCARHGRPWIKAIRMKSGLDLARIAREYADARGLLLDAYRPGVPGGTGEVFDWERIPADLSMPVVLAGGLNPDNIASAVRRVRPWAVDVSGGVEHAKGRKDHQKIAAFVEGVGIAQQ